MQKIKWFARFPAFRVDNQFTGADNISGQIHYRQKILPLCGGSWKWKNRQDLQGMASLQKAAVKNYEGVV